jgi:ferredoxin-NADP reductase
MMIAYTIKERVQENTNTISLYLQPSDGSAVEPFFPGQFITVQLRDVKRNYTLSDSPEKVYYRITVKKEEGGAGSCALHGLLKGQTLLATKTPLGTFYLAPDNRKPLVLLSAGVGLTPMISILNHLVSQNDARDVWFIHSTKSLQTRIMASHLKELQKKVPSVRFKIFLTATSADVNGAVAGRLAPELLEQTLGSLNFSFFICGPASFIQTFSQYLSTRGVPGRDVQYELFTTSTPERVSPSLVQKKAKITFGLSGISFDWESKAETLLDFSERKGISIPFSCRAGTCLTCETRLIEGSVQYIDEPLVSVKEDHILPCCAVPAGDISIEI